MSNLIPEYLPLLQLQKVTQGLPAHTFCPGTSRNHTLQAQSFIQFCDHYHFHFLDPDISTMCLYITHLTRHFSSACSIHNYVSRVRTLHKEMGPLQWHWSPSRCLACSRQLTSPCKCHHCNIFPSFPHCSINSSPSLPAWGPSILPDGCASPSVSLPCSGSQTSHLHLLPSSTPLGTPARGTSSWLLQVFRS